MPVNTGPPTAIPMHASDLAGLAREVDRQTGVVSRWWERHSDRALRWRPAPDRWSVQGHVAHLVLLNREYVPAMQACVADARARGRTGEGPYRHPWIGSRFADAMEPPPRRRIRTMGSMRPDPEAEHVLEDFRAVQAALREVMASAGGVDLGRARFSSPFMRLLRLSLGTGFHTLLAHNRRHLWLAEEVMATEGFPGASQG